MVEPELFQGEVVKWATYNFPVAGQAGKHRPLLGIIEEVGELQYAVDHWLGEKDDAEIDDAVGDIMIFLAHYCGMNGYDLMGCISRHGTPGGSMFSPYPLRDLVVEVGHLAHAHLKDEQGIRGSKHKDEAQQAIGRLVGCLRQFCQAQGQDLTEIISDVWSEVKKRDWIKFPKDGGYIPKPRVRVKNKLFVDGVEVPF